MRAALALIVILTAVVAVQADEGMWQPSQLPQLSSTLKSMGLEIDPTELQDLTTYPMNAVISLGGCTASFVSPDGLVVTNHHCAERSIQHNSTVDRNLLEDGFLAATMADELPAAPGTRVWVTVEVSDVTDTILKGLDSAASGRERYQKIEDREKEMVARCEKDEGHRCDVYTFNGGLEYRLIKKLEIRDVRLVYAPARAIGVYGGDIDNWMWPRHTGDFSFYRAYVDKDGRPAEHSTENVPFHPPHHLKVSTEGVKDGDFLMVAGYPGRTNRHRLSTEVENQFDWYYPHRKAAFEQWLEIIGRETEGREDATIKYASLVGGLNNVVKNYDGMLTGYAKSDILDRKRHLESDLQRWIDSDPDHGARYHDALSELKSLVDQAQSVREREMYYDYLARRGELLRAARTLYRLSREKEKPDKEREPEYQERNWDRLRNGMVRIEKTYDQAVDRAAWRQFILNYAAIPAGQHVEPFDGWFGIRGNVVDEKALDARLDEMYAGTELDVTDKRLAWLDARPEAFEKSSDPFIRLAVALYDSDMKFEEEDKDLQGRFDAARPRYMAALIAYLNSLGRPIYADANSTLRVSYGTVKGYAPKDGVRYAPFTTLAGIAEKATGEEPFDAPAEELKAIRAHRYGRFYDETLGDVPVNFLGTLDSTGGNSGSPTLNARAELVGLLFDGNWESIISDWDFLPDLTRSIHVDIRYTLWVMEELDGAGRLLDEMGVAAKGGAAAAASTGS